ncbi:unnamed protein product [Merluccius merluccius]
MGSMVNFSASLLLSSLLSSICGVPAVRAQDPSEKDALCNDQGCYVVYLRRKTFLESWKACKENGGNLATIKRPEEADTIAALFSNADLTHLNTRVRVWIGLQRHPRQCKPAHPLRGYSWTTGDQDTEYTNWQREDSPALCTASHCVTVGYDSSSLKQSSNFQWLEESCYVPADGYLCRYTYKGMCPALWSEGGGSTLYATPFNLLTTLLTHLPFGTVATVPCPVGTKEDQSVLCMSEEDGVAVGWSRSAPFCTDDAPVSKHWCGQDNGGCEHFCRIAGDQYYCECSEGFQLADDGQNCEIINVCHGAPCESECLSLSDGYRCACPEGYMLAPDLERCLDVDECLQSPCEQLCVNSPGSFECRCREGYHPADDGECVDVDECMNNPCDQACENTPGSHICHCHMGFSISPDDPRHCQERDECQIPGICQQMCVNYVGGFDCECEVGYELGADHYSCQKIEGGDGQPTVTPNFPWLTHQPGPVWNPDFWSPEQSQTDWPHSLDWLTDPPRVQSPDVIWVTSAPQEETPFQVTTDTSSQEAEGDVEGEDGGQFENVFGWEPELTSPTATYTPPPPPTTTAHTTPPPPTPTTHTTPPTTSPTPTPDWYEDEEEDEEEETTTSVSTPPTSTTISEGAWNWLWFSPTPAGHKPATAEYKEPVTDYDISSSIASSSDGSTVKQVDLNGLLEISDEPELAEEEKDNGGQDQSDSVQSDQSEVGKETTSTWLLVGLLVPICIFVLVMVALGVVYCARCAVQPRNKGTSDCYHWISGAHDKQGVQSAAAAGKSHV